MTTTEDLLNAIMKSSPTQDVLYNTDEPHSSDHDDQILVDMGNDQHDMCQVRDNIMKKIRSNVAKFQSKEKKYKSQLTQNQQEFWQFFVDRVRTPFFYMKRTLNTLFCHISGITETVFLYVDDVFANDTQSDVLFAPKLYVHGNYKAHECTDLTKLLKRFWRAYGWVTNEMFMPVHRSVRHIHFDWDHQHILQIVHVPHSADILDVNWLMNKFADKPNLTLVVFHPHENGPLHTMSTIDIGNNQKKNKYQLPNWLVDFLPVDYLLIDLWIMIINYMTFGSSQLQIPFYRYQLD